MARVKNCSPPVDAARRQQLLGANDAHQRPLFGADQVLPSLAASRRKIGRSNVFSRARN